MIKKYDMLYYVLLDKNINITQTNISAESSAAFLTDHDYLVSIAKSSIPAEIFSPFTMACPGNHPEYTMVVTSEEDFIRLTLIPTEYDNKNKAFDAVSFQMRESLSGIFALIPVIVNSINRNDEDKAIAYLENVCSLSYKLLRNTNNISAASRIINNMPLSTETVDLSSLLKSILLSCETVVRDITINHDIQPDIYITTNRNMMSTAILNLIVNSLSFRGDSAPEINISLRIVDNRAVFTYSDNSKGIKDEYQQMVFQPYFSKDPYADGQRDPELGLGLFIVKKAFELSGGNILLSSSFGHGVKYTCSLPVAKPESELLKSAASDFLMNKYSDVYIQLCDFCDIPFFR